MNAESETMPVWRSRRHPTYLVTTIGEGVTVENTACGNPTPVIKRANIDNWMGTTHQVLIEYFDAHPDPAELARAADREWGLRWAEKLETPIVLAVAALGIPFLVGAIRHAFGWY